MPKRAVMNWMLRKDLTFEEKLLRSKYEILRNLKQRSLVTKKPNKENILPGNNPIESQHLQEDSKATAVRILKSKGGLQASRKPQSSETKGFKKPSTQSHEVQSGVKRCVKGEYSPDSNSETRSVVVRGNGLTQQLLRKALCSVGDIWNIRNSDNAESAIVTFKTTDSAKMAVQLDGMVVGEGQKLYISQAKKKNSLWNDVLTSDRKTSIDNHLLQKRRTVYVSFDGLLTSKDFRWFFGSIGMVEKVFMMSPSEAKNRSHRQPGAFVTFAAEEDARRAVKELNGVSLKGILLSVTPQKIPRNDNLGVAAEADGNMTRELVVYPE